MSLEKQRKLFYLTKTQTKFKKKSRWNTRENLFLKKVVTRRKMTKILKTETKKVKKEFAGMLT